MSSSHERNDRRGPGARRPGPHDPRRAKAAGAPAAGLEWLWGRHAVEAALANPLREPKRLLATPERAATLQRALTSRPDERGTTFETLSNAAIAASLPANAVHQGCALLVAPLEDPGLDAVAATAHGVIVVLDQVTDPQNVGAILRSAAAFGARALVVQDRRAPALAGTAAKAAAGAVERVPVVRTVNLARALDRLADMGWRAVGLAADAASTLDEVLDARPTVLVLGSEGDGLRRLVAEHCDALARIAMPGGFESLNVSNAAAVALYAISRAGAFPQHAKVVDPDASRRLSASSAGHHDVGDLTRP